MRVVNLGQNYGVPYLGMGLANSLGTFHFLLLSLASFIRNYPLKLWMIR